MHIWLCIKLHKLMSLIHQTNYNTVYCTYYYIITYIRIRVWFCMFFGMILYVYVQYVWFCIFFVAFLDVTGTLSINFDTSWEPILDVWKFQACLKSIFSYQKNSRKHFSDINKIAENIFRTSAKWHPPKSAGTFFWDRPVTILQYSPFSPPRAPANEFRMAFQ